MASLWHVQAGGSALSPVQGLRPQEGGSAHETEIMTLSWVFVMVIYYPGGGTGVFAHWENGPFQRGSDRALGGFPGQQLGRGCPRGHLLGRKEEVPWARFLPCFPHTLTLSPDLCLERHSIWRALSLLLAWEYWL